MKNNFEKYKIGKIPIHLIIIGVVGLLLLIIGNPFVGDKAERDQKQEEISSEIIDKNTTLLDSEKARYRKDLENRLAAILSRVEGTGEVSVLLQLKGGEKLEVARERQSDATKTKETDAGGGTRIIEEETMTKEYKITREGGEDKPLVLRKLKPEISGVLIVAEGGENIQIQKNLIEAVKRLLDVPSHKIKILPQS